MARNFYVTLPVKDLKRSIDFFEELGFSFNPQFTSENGVALVINDNTSVMLVAESFFSTLSKVPITDPRKATEALFSLLHELIESMPGIWPRWRSSGAATVEAMTSALPPGWFAVMKIAGNSRFGSAATPSRP